MPEVVPEGKSKDAATHPGMLPLMRKMAAEIRTRFAPEFYEGVMRDALEAMAREVDMDAEAFTRAVNAARASSGLAPLVSAEGEVADNVAEALAVYHAKWAEGQEEFIQSRIKAALEAHEASRSGPPIPATEAGGYEGDPPPPRGGARKRA